MSFDACLRCRRPTLDSFSMFNICQECLDREIDARGRYVRNDPA